MVECFQLNDYKHWSSPSGNMGVLISNSEKYYGILRDAFRWHRFSPIWPDQWNKYEYGFFINEIDKDQRDKVIELLDLLTEAICIDDALSQTFALAMHSIPNNEGGGRTTIGELIYQSKPYHRAVSASNKKNARKIAQLLAEFISNHPSYNRSDLLIPVPFHGQKAFDLPLSLAENICPLVEIENGSHYVRKVRDTKAMKNASSEDEKFNLIRGAFEVVDQAALQGKRVIILDDIYQSGNTLHELGYMLQNAGADVLGLVATKTLRTVNQDIQR